MHKHWNTAFSAVGWLSGYLVLVLAPLLVLLIGHVPSGSGFWWDFSMALGFTGMAMMGVQFFLTARFRRVTTPFGIDIIYYFHRYLAIMAVSILLLHVIILQINYPQSLGVLNPLQAPVYMTVGRIALILFMLMIVSSLWRKPLHFHYDEWRKTHITLAVSAFILALSHINGVGYYVNAPAKRWLWGAYTLVWLMLVIYIRLVKPWNVYKQAYRVAEIKHERGCSNTLVLKPQNGKFMPFKPGQFSWLTLNASPWHLKEHPFSMSCSAEVNDRLEFTIKELGDFTRTIKDTQIGDIAYIDGPYGIFSVDEYPQAKGFVFIAGGVGAAPIMSMLRTLADRNDKRPLVFVYANNQWQDVIFREQLEVLKQRLNLNLVHVIKNPPDNWKGESGFITENLLSEILPESTEEFEYFLCGPKVMSDCVQQMLHRFKVPLGNIHFELFDMV